jgi:hypothetical protein
MLSPEYIEFAELLAEKIADKLAQKRSEPEKSITTDKLIELKNITPQTICRWINAGMPVERGRPNRFYLSKVDKWLEKRK